METRQVVLHSNLNQLEKKTNTLKKSFKNILQVYKIIYNTTPQYVLLLKYFLLWYYLELAMVQGNRHCYVDDRSCLGVWHGTDTQSRLLSAYIP